jgi:hypothetical protein
LVCRSQIQRKIEADEQRKRDVKAKAKAMATALATIGESSDARLTASSL